MRAEHDRPSARAVERLATGVGEDVADLRTQLQRALDEAERLAADGRDDLAVTVLEEQREALLTVHYRLQARLADAAVEREAERVLGSAVPAVPEVAEIAPAARAVPAEPAVGGSDGASLRLLASAVAAVLGIALLLSPDLDPNGLTAAGAAGASDQAQVGGQSSRPGEPDTASRTSPSATHAEQEPGAEVRRHLDALAMSDRPSGRHAEDEQRDADLTDAAKLVSPSVESSLDALTHVPDGLAGTGEGAEGDPGAAGSSGDDQDAAGDSGTTGDGASDQSGEGDEPAQDGTSDTGDGNHDTGSDDAAAPPADEADDGSGDQSDDPDGGSSPGGGLDLSGTGEPPVLGR